MQRTSVSTAALFHLFQHRRLTHSAGPAALHAADVLQTVHYMLLEGDAARYLRCAGWIWGWGRTARQSRVLWMPVEVKSENTFRFFFSNRHFANKVLPTSMSASTARLCPTTNLAPHSKLEILALLLSAVVHDLEASSHCLFTQMV